MCPGIFSAREALALLVVLLSLLVDASVRVEGATNLVPRGAGWRFLDGGSDQGTGWKDLSYNDDNWGFGHAELGYGDAVDGRPEVTQLQPGPEPDTRFITYYFRHFFYVADPSAFTNLFVKLLRDDGGIVYLNGVEVFRSGMPEGTVDFETLATAPGASGSNEFKYFVGPADPRLLVSGINLMAVEVHQWDVKSDDLSFNLELAANRDPSEEDATLVRGPYLQLVTTNSITVRWRTLEETTGRVQFGPSPGELSSSVLDANLVANHEITLTGLSPNTRYYYSVGAARTPLAGGPDCSFVTAPLGGKPTRIWAIGDCGTATPQARAVFDRYREFTGDRETDVWLMLGDNAYYFGTDAEYQTAVFNQYPELLRRTALWSTIGNHETYSVEPDGTHAYFKIFTLPTAGQAGGEPSGTEHYYSFDYSNIHFVCLDSEESGRTAGSQMLTWLEEDLAGNHRDWLIVFWHSPPYTKGSHDSDNVFDNFGNMIEMRQYINPILESYGADLVLCGHSHNYERSFLMNGHYGFSGTLEPSMILDAGSGQPADTGAYLKPSPGLTPNKGTVYVVAGSSGWATFQVGRHPAMYSSLLRVGSLVLDVDGNRLDAKFLRDTGAIDDSFTILKGVPPEPVRVTTWRLEEGNVVAKWKSRPGRTYVVQKATSLKPADWTQASEEIQAVGATTTWSDFAAGAEKCFFRVVELPQP